MVIRMAEIYGLLGETLKHSLSPEIHGAFGCTNYKLFEITKDELAAFVRSKKFDGLNVTIPYKKSVMPMLSKVSPEARAIGCVNTVVKLPNGRLYGENTDAYGFSYLLDSSDIDVCGRKCIVIGNGGGAAAVKHVLAERHAGSIVTLTRTGSNRIDNAAEHYDADIIINATPSGMFPDNTSSPISLHGFSKPEAVIDIIYNPLRTRLLLEAEGMGIKAINGLSMLAAQAKRSRELFDGTSIDEGLLSEVIERIEKKQQNIVLIGMPGCGKTVIGKALAEKLCKKHYDIDLLVEKIYGKMPEQIIRKEGEPEFRRTEHVAAEWAGKRLGNIISTGGGIVMREDNYAALKQNGVIVYIDRKTSELSTDGRPLSEGNLCDMAKVRAPIYQSWCDLTVKNDDTVESVADEILRNLRYTS